MKSLLWSLLILLVSACADSPKESSKQNKSETNVVAKSNINETALMAEELETIRLNANPHKNYTWNKNLSELYLRRTKESGKRQQLANWFKYCNQLLFAGETKKCIKSLQSSFGKTEFPFEEHLNKQNKQFFELLALAYLRLGEQENCQLNHTAQSCIIPFQKEGLHQLEEGSRKASVLYKLLQERFPSSNNKWLLNVAHMTLGTYPEGVPSSQILKIQTKEEQAIFPFFKDIAMNLGLAHDGYAGGTCIDDFNNDGFLDVFVSSSGMQDNVQLYLSDQKGGFVNATVAAGLKGVVGGFNSVQADYNNDGYMDIFLLRGAWLNEAGRHPNSLLKNMGDGTFLDVTRSSELLSYHPTQTASWGDFNNDGYLDLFIGNESKTEDPHRCELFRNNGDGTFTDVALERGLGVYAFVKSVSWGDINNDGFPDLYISRLGGENKLFRNEKGFFTDITETAGVSEPIQSFPFWFWDINNDGFEDILVLPYDLTEPGAAGNYVLEMEGKQITGETAKLYLNNGDETFTEASKQYGLYKTMAAMGTNYGDLDNDGHLDFYVGTGTPNYIDIVPNRMFRNVNGERFEEVTSAGNFGHIQKGHGVAFADLDRDGDQDIYAVMGGVYEADNFTNVLYENPISKNNWIVISLKGQKTNACAIGTKVKIELNGGREIYRTVTSGGTFGASPLQLEVGLGKASTIDAITVYWTKSEPQLFEKIEVNQKLLIEEGSSSIKIQDYGPVAFSSTIMNHNNH